MTRPKRPRAHALESESQRAFENLMPTSWVVRPVESDYGIDLEVEIFENGEATGLTFKVQLKGTDASGSAQNRRRVAWSTLAYWRDLDVPVLMCLYSSQSGTTYGRWAHTEIEATSQEQGAATTTVTFSEKHALGSDSWRALQETVAAVREWRRQSTPFPVPVRLKVIDGFGVDKHQLTVSLRSAARSVEDVVRVLGDGNPERCIEVVLKPGELRTSLPDEIASFRLSVPEGYCNLPPSTLSADILLTISLGLQAVGRTREAVQLACNSFLASSNRPDVEIATRITWMLLHTREPERALALAIPLLTSSNPLEWPSGNVLLIAALAEQQSLDADALSTLWEGLDAVADRQEASGDLKESGTTRYNMSHVARAMRQNAKALDVMRRAAALYPAYEQRDYYHKELGGILFDLGEFGEAARSYAKALSMGYDQSQLLPLLSDALLHGGQYQACSDLLQDWRPTGNPLDRLCQINLDASSFLCDVVGLEHQSRRPLTQREEEELANADDAQVIYRVMRASDALDLRAWISLSALQEPCERAISLSVAASREPGFPFFWVMAVLHGINGNLDAVRLRFVIDNAAYFNGDAFVAEMENVADQQEPDTASSLRSVVYEQLARREREELPFTLRMHD